MARRRSGKKIDFVHWTYGSFQTSGFGAGVVGATVLAAQHLPETLLRIRGEWIGFVDGASAPGTLASIGIGLIHVPEGTGSTVLWSPITDGDAPWIWVDYALIGYEEMVVDVVDVPTLSAVRRVIDSKAMRITKNSELQFVAENATVSSAVTMSIAGQARVLSGT